jgi:sulfide dehydrogenase cytochrome subunit
MRTSIRLFTVIPVLVTGVLLVPAVQAGELSRAPMLSASCEGCHGTYGRSPGAIPTIAGKSADYLIETMKAFRAGDKESTVMGRHSKGYSDEEIVLIAKFFSRQSEQQEAQP